MKAQRAVAGGLDIASRQLVHRFIILLALLILWAVALNAERPVVALATVTFVAAGIEMFHACLRREPFNGASLNHWDSATAFLGLSCLARGLG
jgi:hypothetical protein